MHASSFAALHLDVSKTFKVTEELLELALFCNRNHCELVIQLYVTIFIKAP